MKRRQTECFSHDLCILATNDAVSTFHKYICVRVMQYAYWS
jgi:hypothetical protein